MNVFRSIFSATSSRLLPQPGTDAGPAAADWPPPGHFYSPVVDFAAIEQCRARVFDADTPVHGIDMHDGEQTACLRELAAFYDALPFGDEPEPGLRYHYRNPTFGHADGIILATMIRKLRPKRIIEVGSGHSSCVILDVNERFSANAIECSFIDPHTELVRSLFKPQDFSRVKIIDSAVQNVGTELFQQLEANDILFIDSTHVSKCDSDVNHHLFRILPALSSGVVIHFHDIFFPFEYPEDWVLRLRRSWNEIYALRAFLMHNDKYRITLFNSYIWQKHRDLVEQLMPKFSRNSGGSLWLTKV